MHGDGVDKFIDDLKTLVDNYNIRKTIEIEKKYCIEDENIFNKVQDYLSHQNIYKFEKGNEISQLDVYYDTIDSILRKNNSTLRIRRKDSMFELTIKLPAIEEQSSNDQSIRLEYQKQITENNIENEFDYIEEHLKIWDKNKKLRPNLIIHNLRTPIEITNKDIIFEMVLDKVTYENYEGNKVNDFQIEIELKSSYPHRVNLKMLTDDIERNVNGLVSSKTSKYLRGLQLISSP
jgi:inorganic triphosphatase YgiF